MSVLSNTEGKECSGCGIFKNLSEFRTVAGGKARGVCKKCYNNSRRLRYAADPEYRERVRNDSRKRYNNAKDYYQGKQREYQKKDPIAFLMLGLKRRVRDRGEELSIDRDFLNYLWERQLGKCAISGIEFTQEGHYKASVDRIDSKIGYSRENVQLVAWIVNRMKTDLEEHVFVSVCEKIAMNAAGVGKKTKGKKKA